MRSRFYSLLGVDTRALVELDATANTSLSGALGTQIMRLVNGCSLMDEQRQELARRAKEMDLAAAEMGISRRLLSPEQLQAVGRHFLESNGRLAQEFVGQPLEGFWFQESSPGA